MAGNAVMFRVWRDLDWSARMLIPPCAHSHGQEQRPRSYMDCLRNGQSFLSQGILTEET